MGYILTVRCEDCGNAEEFYIGQGIRDWDKNVVLTNFTDNRVRKALDKAESWSFRWKIGVCDDCKKLLRVPVLDIFDKEKKELTDATCQCGRQITSVLDDSDEYKNLQLACPKCGGVMKAHTTGFWD